MKTTSRRFAALRSLRGRLALWIAGAMLACLVVFGAVSYVLLVDEEASESTSEPRDEIAADVQAQVLKTMSVVAPFAVLLATLGAYWLTRRVMRPIDEVIRAAAVMSAEDLDRRLPLPETDDELRALVESVNGLFARLERGYAAQASFASDASHELRTPLAVIISELEVALRRPRSEPEWTASANAVLAEARKASRLADALLRHARAGVARRQHGSVDAAELVDRVTNANKAAAAELGLSLSVRYADGVGEGMEGDKDALEAALGSVVANALRYTNAGGRIEVTVERGEPKALCIHVDDSGLGVAPHERELIFSAFVRGEQGQRVERSGGEGGSGLGLAMARRIVEAHAGTLLVSTAPLGGARFTFTLPISAAAAPTRS
jgi:signal transduction histidine kinase